MSRRKVIAHIKEILDDFGFGFDLSDIPGSVARAVDEAWRNGYCVGYDEAENPRTSSDRLG